MTTLKGCPVKGCKFETQVDTAGSRWVVTHQADDHYIELYELTEDEAIASWNSLSRAEDAERAFEAGRHFITVHNGKSDTIAMSGDDMKYPTYADYLASKGTKE